MISAPALFASAFHPHIGGVEELVRQLALEQRRRGLHPTILTNRFPKYLEPTEQVAGLRVHRYAFRVPGTSVRHLGGWIAAAATTHLAVARDLRSLGTDLVHVQCVSSNASYALSSSRLLSLPLVVTMQGELTMDASGVYQGSGYLRRLWRHSLDRANVITGCSQFVLNEAEEALGRPFAAPARVIYNGISLAEYDQPAPANQGSPYVLGIGRMVPQKGFDVLLEAFRELAKKLPELALVLAGDGVSRPELQAKAHRLGLSDRVSFPGRVDHSRAVELFRGAELFVLPSRHEPQGIVVLEAMAAGTPVVAAAVGGVPEIVRDGDNGLLFTGGDPIALAETVITAFDCVADLVAAGRRTAAAHDWRLVSQQYLDAYEEAAA